MPYLLERVLRGAVVAHARAERRRLHPMVLHVGLPGGRVRSFELSPVDRLDHALRTEIIEAMAREHLARDTVPLVWLTRPPTAPDDEDLDWAAAAGSAGGELGVRLDAVVITRRSWRDPRSGVGRSWTRIRAATS
ncbi:hypothetical protein ASE01_12585 [Nocardioides sp. Root190]|nr:hypothetical protein ASE01_12585 [Nocardioides sp. Root190]